MSNQHEGQWDDDAIVAMLKRRQHHTTLQNGWHLITLMSAAELMRMVRDDLQAQINALRQELAGRVEWTPVNPISMANDEYADAEIKLCYRRLTPASLEE